MLGYLKNLQQQIQDEKEIFLQVCRNTYELLYYRGIELGQILMNALTMKQKVERHRQVLSYQLQRMYRIRNKFVHHSMIDDNIDVLCKHMRVQIKIIEKSDYTVVRPFYAHANELCA